MFGLTALASFLFRSLPVNAFEEFYVDASARAASWAVWGNFRLFYADSAYPTSL